MTKDLKASIKDYNNLTYDPLYKADAITKFSIKEDVTEGKIHIGALQANSNNVGTYPFSTVAAASNLVSAWAPGHNNKPAVEIDEDYFGTYHVEKNMTLEVPYSKNKPTYDWLPCTCNGGWDDMTPHDKVYHSAKGFFDCTECMPLAACKN